MRITVDLDERLLEDAEQLTRFHSREVLIHEGLRVLIERERAKHLMRMGGSDPHVRRPPRRRLP